MMNWIVLRNEQQDVLPEVFVEAGSPLLMSTGPDVERGAENAILILVPSSSKDKRRWDIDRSGELLRCDRDTGKPVRGNRFPQRILKTVPR
jgi:hypothetical protein